MRGAEEHGTGRGRPGRRVSPAGEALESTTAHLARLEQLLDGAELVLEALRCAALLLDGAGRVCGANRRAAAILERGDCLVLERRRLRASDPDQTAALQHLVRQATEAEERSGGILALARRGPGPALLVSVTPLQGRREQGGPWLPGLAGLVRVSDPEDLQTLPEPALRALYALTRAEARVAARIAQGEAVAAIATALGIGRATVRSHLRELFAKTGTRRQAQLVRVLLAAAAMFTDRERPPGDLA